MLGSKFVAIPRTRETIHQERGVYGLVLAHFRGEEGLWAVREIRQGGTWFRVITIDLIDKQDNLWGHKPMDETVGPRPDDCPLAFLAMVPCPGGYATAWRERVKFYHRQQLVA